MKRFTQITPFGMGLQDYELPPQKDFGESLADKRYFSPTADSVRTISSSALPKQYYDYPDGIDTGAPVPIARRKGVDMAVLSNVIRSEQNAIKEALDSANQKMQIHQQLDSVVNPSPVNGVQ